MHSGDPGNEEEKRKRPQYSQHFRFLENPGDPGSPQTSEEAEEPASTHVDPEGGAQVFPIEVSRMDDRFCHSLSRQHLSEGDDHHGQRDEAEILGNQKASQDSKDYKIENPPAYPFCGRPEDPRRRGTKQRLHASRLARTPARSRVLIHGISSSQDPGTPRGRGPRPGTGPPRRFLSDPIGDPEPRVSANDAPDHSCPPHPCSDLLEADPLPRIHPRNSRYPPGHHPAHQ